MQMTAAEEEAWKRLDGFKFFAGPRVMRLRTGMYSTGNAGAELISDRGPECKLTVNMYESGAEDVELAEGEFFVRHADADHLPSAFDALQKLGVIEQVDAPPIASGFVQSYASRHRLARCQQGEKFAAACDCCHERWATKFRNRVEKIEATDAAKRLKGGR